MYPNQYPNVTPYVNPYANQQQTQAQNVNNTIVWVNGIEGAKGYQISPNSIVQLMDSENDGIFYIKVSDNIGMSTLRVFQYTEIEQNTTKNDTNVDLSEFVRKGELKALITSILTEENTNEQTVQPVAKKSSKILIPEQ